VTDEERVAYVRAQIVGADASRGPGSPVREGHEDRAALLRELDRVTRERNDLALREYASAGSDAEIERLQAEVAELTRACDIAFRAGAEAMRYAAAAAFDLSWTTVSREIRAMPLPTPAGEKSVCPPCGVCGHLTTNDGRCLNCEERT